jgi:chromosome segregation ATPase
LSRTTRLETLQAREHELRSKISDVEIMLRAVEAGRERFERALEGMQNSNDEMKGQYRILKERQAWLIGEQDKLKAEQQALVQQIAKMTNPGDSR